GAHPGEDRRLESAERDVVIVLVRLLLVRREHRAWEVVRRRIALLGDTLYDRPARIAQPKDLGDLVECLARGVVPGLAQELVAPPLRDPEQHRVPAGDEERDERRARRRVLELRREEV